MGRPVALAIGLLVAGTSATSSALVAPRGVKSGLVATDGAVRAHRDVVTKTPSTAAHRALFAAIDARQSLWDGDTGVVLRLWGRGLAQPGAVASPDLAARGARDLLDRHLAALAPGSAPADLVLVSNVVSGRIRSVGFVQHYHGRPVLGGQVSFRYKADRLVMIGSEALPHVAARLAAVPVSAAVARARATAAVLADHATATAGAVDGPFILPLIAPRGPSGLIAGKPRYREVLRVTVAAESPVGRYAVYVDAATGDVVAREQTLRFASGTVAFNVPQRGPLQFRPDLPAPFVAVTVNGSDASTDAAGAVTFADGPPAAVTASAVGTFVRVSNDSGPNALKDLQIPPGGITVWNDAADETIDAQLATYIHANIVKQRIRSIDPTFAYLDQQLTAVVNINDICNAFSDGDQINFFLSGAGCENTGRISDVVYHEFGHSAHTQAIIPGVGAFEGALSEGISDYLASTITDDSGLARGFFLDTPNDPLRESNPVGDEWRWPDDLTGEVHDDGRIIAGTLWDLRELLKAKLGPDPGIARADLIWFESIRRAVDIPTMYPEALLTDDDDGDLANGTPNDCEINLAFDAHGLVGAGGISGAVTLGAQQQDGFPISVALQQGATECVDISPTDATLSVRVPNEPEQLIPMTPTGDGFSGLIPIAPDGTLLEYQVIVGLSDGGELVFPRNPGDPRYQLYIGPVTPIACTSFENPPELAGWTPSGEFQFGPPQGQAGDPATAFLGGSVAGVNLSGAYAVGGFSSLESPVIDTLDFSTVRLQYRRWLTVEDGIFDQATISVNGQGAWQNLADFGGTHTRDEEWRFHDVELTDFVQNGTVQLRFDIAADGGLEFGGWNIDQLCVVGTDAAPPAAFCGDGNVDPGEGCDAGPGNSDAVPGACRTNCQPARCADFVIDPGETCDDGNTAAGDGCSAACQIEPATTTVGDDDGTLPTSGFDDSGESGATDGSGSSGDTDPGEDDLADRPGCGCRSDAPAGSLGLAVLLLLARRRRR